MEKFSIERENIREEIFEYMMRVKVQGKEALAIKLC